MANVSIGSYDVFNSMVNGVQSRENLSFLEQRLGEFRDRLTDAGRRVADRARELFDSYDFEGIQRQVRAFKRKMEHRWDRNDIRPLRTIGDLQQAGLQMQRWLMANPTVRRMWQKERCDGWSRSYVDMEPGALGESHTDYKKVMNGLAQQDEEDNTYFVTYFDAIEDGREELDLDQQLDIRESWSWIEHYLKQGGDDPTSPTNASL